MRHEYSDMHTIVFMFRALSFIIDILYHLLSINAIYKIDVMLIFSFYRERNNKVKLCM